MKLRRPARRATLVLHIAFSVSWLGLSLGLLALAVTAATSGSTEAMEASYRSMKVFTDWLILPVALITLGTGLLLSLGTPWGLAQHRWVYTKFWLTLVTTAASVFALRPSVDNAAAQAVAGVPVEGAAGLVVPPLVSLSAYAFMTALSVLKPWGLTRRGRKVRSSGRKPLDAEGLRQTA
ncbi:DUF2269 domain-containing protein [Streptomyces sp. NPDC058001]|uniref:DUF2269 domain-containing protein n=1 Tax=Streptomyces sp. NPDC058001 TaxID=3346300 RepID=UPI0036E1B349